MADRLLLESSATDGYLLEDGSGVILLEAGPQTDAPAGNAAGTGAANQPAAKVAPNGGNAAGTGTAYNASVSTTTRAGVATGTGAAYPVAPGISPTAGNAAATGTAYQPSVALSAFAGAASGTGTGSGAAFDARTSAGVASGVGTANTAAASIAPSAGVASGTGAAYNALTGARDANAGRAVGFGSAGLASPGTGTASGRGTAYDATVSFDDLPADLPEGFEPDAFTDAFQGGAAATAPIFTNFDDEDLMARFTATVALNLSLRGGCEVIGPAGTTHSIPSSLYDEFNRDQAPLIPGGVTWLDSSAPATTLGSVVKRIQIFDVNGSPIGYVPVYDSIT